MIENKGWKEIEEFLCSLWVITKKRPEANASGLFCYDTNMYNVLKKSLNLYKDMALDHQALRPVQLKNLLLQY
jgi:hypothetical protein